jgi:hypothetical protein
MKKTLDKMDKKTKPGKPTKPVKHPEREHKPRPLDDDAMPPIITPDLPQTRGSINEEGNQMKTKEWAEGK